MLLSTEVPLAELTRGDSIAVEVDGEDIWGFVVGTNVEHGTIGFVPRINHTAVSEVLTVEPGKFGVKVFKLVDSEAAVTELLTWESIAELEPEVLVLLDGIEAERPNEYNHFSIWGKYKERLSQLVGWEREANTYPQLRSSAAYNVVYYKLLENLKDPEEKQEFGFWE